jgi:hypothetical protein
MNFNFSTIGSNESGTRIFCKLSYDKHNVLRGFYDFDLDKFIIIKYLYDNFPQGLTKNKVRKALKEILTTDYDWEL